MRINYSPVPGIEKSRILMPIVPVNLIHGKYKFSTYALIDSGAVGGVISTVIADTLRIKWEKIKAQEGYSVGGIFRFHPVKLQVEAFDHHFSLRLSIVEGISAYRCILGQADIFQRAKIIFEGYKKQFEIIFREYN